jgi:hypothetical protein
MLRWQAACPPEDSDGPEAYAALIDECQSRRFRRLLGAAEADDEDDDISFGEQDASSGSGPLTQSISTGTPPTRPSLSCVIGIPRDGSRNPAATGCLAMREMLAAI